MRERAGAGTFPLVTTGSHGCSIEPGPRISVVMPLYNAVAFVGEALQSIAAQTWPVAEVIVVDDASTDGSADVAATFPFVTLRRESHRGISGTMNRALDFVSGDYIAFLDNDDRWVPEKTAWQMAVFQSNPTLDMVFGHARRFQAAKAEGQPEQTIDIIRGVTKGCMLIKRASFEKAGRFPEGEQAHDFLDWYSRAREAQLSGAVLPQVVLERRIHENNYSVLQRGHQHHTYLQALKASLDRRRNSQGLREKGKSGPT